MTNTAQVEGGRLDALVGHSIVRHNLMTRAGYTPYCGDADCWLRTIFNGSQFECRRGHWVSDFPAEFIAAYKARWTPNAQVKGDAEPKAKRSALEPVVGPSDKGV